MRIKIIEKIWQIISDFLGIILAFLGAYFFRLGTFSHSEFPFLPYFEMGVLISIFWLLLLAISGRYELKEHSVFDDIKGVIFSSLSASLLFPLAFYFTAEVFFSRGIVLLIFLFGISILLLISFLERKLISHRVQNDKGVLRMLIIGADRSSERIINQLIQVSSYHKPVAILSPYGSKKKDISGVKILGKLDALERIFASEKIDEIFLCEGIEHSENLASFCRNKGIPLKTSLETMGIYHHKILAEEIGSTTFLTLHQSPLFGWGQFFKRGSDLIFSSISLLFLSPYFLFHKKNIISCEYQNGIESAFTGYIFQNKKGEYYGRNIALILSVFTKKASFVGPYAYRTQEYNTMFSIKKESLAMRFILRPGIYSPGNNLSPDDLFRSEVLYIRNWSFLNDLKILLKALKN